MKILIESLTPDVPRESGEDTYMEMTPGNACVRITQAFNAVIFETEDGARYGIALRDSGLEIVCPDQTLVGVKRYEDNEVSVYTDPTKKGQTFIERNGEVLG